MAQSKNYFDNTLKVKNDISELIKPNKQITLDGVKNVFRARPHK